MAGNSGERTRTADKSSGHEIVGAWRLVPKSAGSIRLFVHVALRLERRRTANPFRKLAIGRPAIAHVTFAGVIWTGSDAPSRRRRQFVNRCVRCDPGFGHRALSDMSWSFNAR